MPRDIPRLSAIPDERDGAVEVGVVVEEQVTGVRDGPDADASGFAELAAAHGVSVLPGPTCSPVGGSTEHLRISLGPHPDVLLEGARRLEEVWHAHTSGSGAASHIEVVI